MTTATNPSAEAKRIAGKLRPFLRETPGPAMSDPWTVPVERVASIIDDELDLPALLESLANLLDLSQLGTDSYCEICERHAPKNERGELTGPVVHVGGCPVSLGLAALKHIRGNAGESNG